MVKQILVPLDFAEGSVEMLASLKHQFPQAKLLLLHVRDDFLTLYASAPAAGLQASAPYLAGILEEVEAHVDAQLQKLSETFNALAETHRGPLVATILKVIQSWPADLVVMRAPKRRWLGRIFSPSITHQVIRKASRPVMIWRPLSKEMRYANPHSSSNLYRSR